jgi:hypothetical protein
VHGDLRQSKEMSRCQAQVPNDDHVVEIANDRLHPAKGFYRCRHLFDGDLGPFACVFWIWFRAVDRPPRYRQSGCGLLRYRLLGIHSARFLAAYRSTELHLCAGPKIFLKSCEFSRIGMAWSVSQAPEIRSPLPGISCEVEEDRWRQPIERWRSERNNLAPQVGFEPTTLRLTAECSTIELLRSIAPASHGVVRCQVGFIH